MLKPSLDAIAQLYTMLLIHKQDRPPSIVVESAGVVMVSGSNSPYKPVLLYLAATLAIVLLAISFVLDPNLESLATFLGAVVTFLGLIALSKRLDYWLSAALFAGVVCALIFVVVNQHQAKAPSTEATFPKIYGHRSEKLEHRGGGGVSQYCAGVSVKNFIAETVFHNPYDAGIYPWSYGMFFRYTSPADQYRISINSTKRLGVGRTQSWQGHVIKERLSVKEIDNSISGLNRMRVKVQNGEGTVSINGEAITSFDVSTEQDAGDVCVVTGMLGGDSIVGKKTTFEDFHVYKLPDN